LKDHKIYVKCTPRSTYLYVAIW